MSEQLAEKIAREIQGAMLKDDDGDTRTLRFRSLVAIITSHLPQSPQGQDELRSRIEGLTLMLTNDFARGYNKALVDVNEVALYAPPDTPQAVTPDARRDCRGNETGYHTCGLPIGGCGKNTPQVTEDAPWIACSERLPDEDVEGKDHPGDTVSVRCQIRDGEGRSEFAKLHYPTNEWCWRTNKGEWSPADWRVAPEAVGEAQPGFAQVVRQTILPLKNNVPGELYREVFIRVLALYTTTKALNRRASSTPVDAEPLDAEIAEVQRLYEQMPEGPYFVGFDDGSDCPNHANSGLAVVDTGRESDWPIARHCHWPVAKWIIAVHALMPRLIASRARC